MPITPNEAAKNLDAKIAEQIKEECVAIDAFLSVHWHTGRNYLTMPCSDKVGIQAREKIMSIYRQVGWNMTYEGNDDNDWFQFKEKTC